MRKKIPLLFCSFLICVILAETRTANAQTSTMAVDPASLEIAAPGELFTVNITITNAPIITQFIINDLTWDPDILELETGTVNDFVEGPFLKSVPGSTTVWLVQAPQIGRAPEISNAYMTGGPCPGGDGVLFTIRFRAKANGTSSIHVDAAWLLNGLQIADTPTLENGSVIVIPEFPTSMVIPAFLITTTVTLIAAIVLRKRRNPIKIP
jgi:hypothetical protein